MRSGSTAAADLGAPVAAARLRRAALGTAAVFALSGFLIAAWLSRLPATRDRLHADSGSLGIALLMTGVGSLAFMPFTGWLCARLGSRAVVAGTALPACAVLVALAYAPTVWATGGLLFLMGGLYGSWDVAMNVQGSFIDRQTGRDLMPRYHACWSVGGIIGAGCGALAAHASLAPPAHFLLAALVTACLLGVALPFFLPDRGIEDLPSEQAGAPEDRPRLLSRTLILIGLVTLCATWIEGAAGDWLALFLTDGRGTDQSVAAVGYAVFAVAMASGRFSGTTVIARLGRVSAVRLGGLVTGIGVAATVLLPGLAGSLLGAMAWGLGVSIVFPAAMSAGGETPGRATDGIAAVSTIGYGGFLLGPPTIGLLAQHVGLGSALLVLVVLAAGIVTMAPALTARAAAGASSRRAAGRPTRQG